uniref:MTB3p n=1 Tax=Tetrahymena thermophila TaxID=5911 RepID=M1KDT2_TETTH|nr:MTB3p [Tetrahymena thermophila]
MTDCKIFIWFYILYLISKFCKCQVDCYLASSTQIGQQIQPIAYSQRQGQTSFGAQYFFTIQLASNQTDILQGTSSVQFTQYFLTSNKFVLSSMISKNMGLLPTPQQYVNSTYYVAAAFTYQQFISGALDFSSICNLDQYPLLTLKEFVQVNTQTQQMFVSVPLTSQINDVYYLTLFYPTSLASQPQNNNNLGCQLYTDYIVINQCSLVINSTLTTVSFNLSSINIRNISATLVLSTATFNQNFIKQNQPFQIQLLNQLQNKIAQSPAFGAKDYRQCQLTNFQAQLIFNNSYSISEQRLQVQFATASPAISRILIEFSSQILPKFNLTNVLVMVSDLSKLNPYAVFCQKAYQSIILCELFSPASPFDMSKGVILTLPYFQPMQAVPQNSYSFTVKYFTDSTYQTCYNTNITIPFIPQDIESPVAFLFNNDSLLLQFSNVINLETSTTINIQLPSQLSFAPTSQLAQITGISSLSKILISSSQNSKISQVTQSLQQLTTNQGIQFQLLNVTRSSIFCSLTNIASLQIQIVNSFGVVIMSGTVPIQIQSYSIIVTSINSNQILNLQQQDNDLTIPVSLEVNFQLKARYFPQSSAFVIQLPLQLTRDNRFSQVTVEIVNEFNFFCKSQTNSTKFSTSKVTYQNTVQQRDTLVIQCQFSGNQTINISSDVFTAKIQGYQLPMQVQKPTDRVIINLVDFSQNSFNEQYYCQSSENQNIPDSLKNIAVFVKTQSTNFIVSQYSYQITSYINQNKVSFTAQSLINITTNYSIQDGDLIEIEFGKQAFFKFEISSSSQQQISSVSEVKNLACSVIYPLPAQPNSVSFIPTCVLVEKASSFSIQFQLYPSQLGQVLNWNNKDVVLNISGLAFQENLQQNYQSEVLFSHSSSDLYLLSQSNQTFNNQLSVTANSVYQVSQISTLSSLAQDYLNYKFDFIQLQFSQSILVPQSNSNFQLTLNFSQQIYLSTLSYCSLDSLCSQRTQIVQCNLSSNSTSLTLDNIGSWITCSSVLSSFNITIHNPEINNQNSTGGAAQSIAINWNLTSTTSSQTLLSGHTSLTTNTSQCPQPHCATCTSPPSICIHCTQGYYLLPDQNSCVQTCPPPTVAHQQTATCQPCFQHQECLQCQSQNPAACTSCSPTYSLNSTLLPYCYVPLPPSSSASSSVTKDVVNRTPSNSTFSGALNRPEPGQPSQKQQQQQQQQQQQEQQQQQQQQQEAQASDQRGFAHFLAQTKSYTKGFILTLLIPLSILGACLTRLVTFCLKKREKKVHPPLPSESRSAQIAQNLDERQETQKDGNGGDEEQMRASSRVDTANMCPLNSRRGEQLQLEGVQQQSDGGVGGGESEGNGYLAFCWIAVILLLGNVGDLVEVPYIIFSQQNSFSNKSTTNVFDLQFSEADMGQICCLSYIALNAVCYLICIVMMVKAIIFETGSGEPLFCIYEVKLSSSSSFCGEEMKKDKSEAAACKGDSNAQNENGEKHKKVLSGRKLWKLIIDVFLRCLVVVGGKAFCMVYSNVANVKGWLTCQVDKNLRAFRLFYMTLCIHAIFNMISAVFFTLMLTHFSFASWTAVAQDSLTSQGSDGGVEFSFFVDILAFKFLMSLICFLNCLHIQQLISACKSPNLPGPQNPVSHRLQSPSTPSSSASPADAVERDACKVSYFENTPNAAEKTTPTAVTLASYRQQETSGTGSQNLIEGRPRRKKPSKLSLLLKRDSGQKSGSSLSSRQQETPSPNLPSYSPNLYPSQAYI